MDGGKVGDGREEGLSCWSFFLFGGWATGGRGGGRRGVDGDGRELVGGRRGRGGRRGVEDGWEREGREEVEEEEKGWQKESGEKKA